MAIRYGSGARSRSRPVRTTVSLPEDLLAGIDAAVAAGEFGSRNELLADAVARELRRLREEAIDRDFEEMANDPDLMAEELQIMKEFAGADAETARMMDELDGGWKE
jgi:Arc/MetJ-type ribon-helix-helix transcriptional regulator